MYVHRSIKGQATRVYGHIESTGSRPSVFIREKRSPSRHFIYSVTRYRPISRIAAVVWVLVRAVHSICEATRVSAERRVYLRVVWTTLKSIGTSHTAATKALWHCRECQFSPVQSWRCECSLKVCSRHINWTGDRELYIGLNTCYPMGMFIAHVPTNWAPAVPVSLQPINERVV